MKEKYKKPLITLLTLSIVSVIFGILFLIFACHGECGSDVHGGLWTFVCPRFYVSLFICVVMIAIGATGIFATIMLNNRYKQIQKLRTVLIKR